MKCCCYLDAFVMRLYWLCRILNPFFQGNDFHLVLLFQNVTNFDSSTWFPSAHFEIFLIIIKIENCHHWIRLWFYLDVRERFKVWVCHLNPKTICVKQTIFHFESINKSQKRVCVFESKRDKREPCLDDIRTNKCIQTGSSRGYANTS